MAVKNGDEVKTLLDQSPGIGSLILNIKLPGNPLDIGLEIGL